MTNILILSATILAGAVLLLSPLARARLWRATITPLASIIGSGFLVLGPILNAAYGGYAPLAMAVLCLCAYAFGAAIRFNIGDLGDGEDSPRHAVGRVVETASSWVLAAAYVVSVAYYLNLFGAFGVHLTPWDGPVPGRLLTSAIFVLILITGWTRGFVALERLEQVTVGLKLAVIVGLLVGLCLYFVQRAGESALMFNPPDVTGWAAATLGFGLIVTVQGFETSRYLGDTYDAATRIRSMKLAQWVASAIYLIYALLLAWIFAPDRIALNETAIIDMMAVVAPILPLLLVAAALAAQFSAAVADTSGSGGLIHELTRTKLSVRQAYALVVSGGLILTWSANVFVIISYASRAFALYYALQAMLAALAAHRQRRSLVSVGFALLAVLGVVIAVFGTPVEGS